MTEVRTAIIDYAKRVHRAIGADHHIASPFGAWLVLALAAPAADDELRPRIEAVLGMPADEAATAARSLLASTPAVVHLAAAAWLAEHSAALDAWVATLPAEVDAGPVPSKAEADEWANEHTVGLIKQFPMDLRGMALVLSTAIACDISWRRAFDAEPVGQLTMSPAPGFDSVGSLLSSTGRDRIHVIVDTEHGLMAAHAAPATDSEMLVVSVIADRRVPAAIVLEHAHTIATALARSSPMPGQVSLFDVPLGPGHSWTVSEHKEFGSHDAEHFDAVLPAWSVSSQHNLMDLDDIGFEEAGEALRKLVGGLRPEAVQVAVAEYTRTGFKAAAITAIAVRASAAMRQQTQIRVRTAHVEYTHPHAVVAVAVDDKASPWAGMPLFSAWIAHADEAD